MTKKLETIDAETLMSTLMEPLKFIVSGLIPQGLHILAGSPLTLSNRFLLCIRR